MAKLIDVVADLRCTGPGRKLAALAEVAQVIDREHMQVTHESDGRIINFDDAEMLSDITEGLMQDGGFYRLAFRDACECKHEVSLG